EVLDECLVAIDKRNAELNAFVHLDPEAAHRQAAAVDARVARGEDPGPLAGVPFGVKDLEECAGMPTSQGSLLYKGRPPVEDDSVHVARLRAAGAVPVGKTAAPEFGSTCFTDTKAWGTTRNPWDPTRTPGGSSGGSAAAVAAGMVPFCTASGGGGRMGGSGGPAPRRSPVRADKPVADVAHLGCMRPVAGPRARHVARPGRRADQPRPLRPRQQREVGRSAFRAGATAPPAARGG